METTKVNSNQITGVHESALNELFIEELQDVYWAEKHLLNAFPNLAKKTTSNELREMIENRFKETENHIKRLKHVFESIDAQVSERKSEGMAGLIKEGERIVHDTENGSLIRDAGIVAAVQKIEHYEIASYGTLKTMAEVLGHHEAVNLLEATLQEEKHTNNLLTQLSKRQINQLSTSEKG